MNAPNDYILRRLRAACRYCPDTGELYWQRSPYETTAWNNKYAGKRAFISVNNGYHRGKFMQTGMQASNVAWFLHCGEWPQHIVDHLDGDTLNDRWLNLEAKTQSENLLNCKRTKNRYGLPGVEPVGGGYTAMVCLNRKKQRLSVHDTPEAAYAERAAWYKSRGREVNDRL